MIRVECIGGPFDGETCDVDALFSEITVPHPDDLAALAILAEKIATPEERERNRHAAVVSAVPIEYNAERDRLRERAGGFYVRVGETTDYRWLPWGTDE